MMTAVASQEEEEKEEEEEEEEEDLPDAHLGQHVFRMLRKIPEAK